MRKRLICFALACNMLFPFSAIQALAEGPETIPVGMEENQVSEETDAEEKTDDGDETFDQNTNEIHVIRGFGDFDIQGHYISVTEDGKPDEEELIAQMPKTLEVFLDNSTTTVSIPVSWACVEDYDHSEYYYYQFSPCFDPELYELDPSIDILKDAPYIGVFFQNEDENSYSSYALTSDSLGTGATGNKNEPIIFEYLVNEKGVNVAAVCGILANLKAESDFRPNNLQNSCESKLGTDEEYTAKVDSGEYINFADDSAGYGLCQWTSSGRKKKLLEFAQSRGCSIADMEMQLDFMMEELKSYSKVYDAISSAELSGDGAYDVGYAFCYYYEAPANKENSAVSRGNQARDTYWEYYKDFIDDDNPEPGEQIADADYTGLTMYHDELYYARDGVWDSSYTGLADYQGTTYYVQYGQVDQSFTGLVEQDGIVYYVENGRTKPDFTGIVYLDDKGYYIVDGIWASDCTSLVKYDDIWYYIVDGVLADDYTGLVKYYSTWYYVEKGVLNWDYTGLTKYYSTWYYVEKGVLNWDYTGLTKYYSTWYYVEKGVLNWDYTGLLKYYSTWYYVERGVLNWDYTGLVKYYSTWYYVRNGVLDRNFSGTVIWEGKTYTVKNGVVV